MTLGEVARVDRIRHEGVAKTYVGMEDIESGTGRFTGSQLPSSAKSATYAFDDSHVLYGRLRPYLNKVLVPDFSGHCSSEIVPLVPEPSLDRRFLAYWLRSPLTVELANRTTTGARMPRANVDELMSFEISLPPIDEQVRIVSLLDEAHEGVQRLQAEFDQALALTAALRTQVFDDAFTSNDGWKSLQLGNVCRLINGRAYKKAEFLPDGSYPVLRVGNFFTNKTWVYSDLELDEDKYCVDGDLLYAWSGSFGPRIWKGPKAIYHYHIWKVIPDESKVTKAFLYRLLQWDVERIRRDHGTGTTMIHVTKGSMEQRPVRIPPLRVQEAVCSDLATFEASLAEYEAVQHAKANAIGSLGPALLRSLLANQ